MEGSESPFDVNTERKEEEEERIELQERKRPNDGFDGDANPRVDSSAGGTTLTDDVQEDLSSQEQTLQDVERGVARVAQEEGISSTSQANQTDVVEDLLR